MVSNGEDTIVMDGVDVTELEGKPCELVTEVLPRTTLKRWK